MKMRVGMPSPDAPFGGQMPGGWVPWTPPVVGGDGDRPGRTGATPDNPWAGEGTGGGKRSNLEHPLGTVVVDIYSDDPWQGEGSGGLAPVNTPSSTITSGRGGASDPWDAPCDVPFDWTPPQIDPAEVLAESDTPPINPYASDGADDDSGSASDDDYILTSDGYGNETYTKDQSTGDRKPLEPHDGAPVPEGGTAGGADESPSGGGGGDPGGDVGGEGAGIGVVDDQYEPRGTVKSNERLNQNGVGGNSIGNGGSGKGRPANQKQAEKEKETLAEGIGRHRSMVTEKQRGASDNRMKELVNADLQRAFGDVTRRIAGRENIRWEPEMRFDGGNRGVVSALPWQDSQIPETPRGSRASRNAISWASYAKMPKSFLKGIVAHAFIELAIKLANPDVKINLSIDRVVTEGFADLGFDLDEDSLPDSKLRPDITRSLPLSSVDEVFEFWEIKSKNSTQAGRTKVKVYAARPGATPGGGTLNSIQGAWDTPFGRLEWWPDPQCQGLILYDFDANMGKIIEKFDEVAKKIGEFISVVIMVILAVFLIEVMGELIKTGKTGPGPLGEPVLPPPI